MRGYDVLLYLGNWNAYYHAHTDTQAFTHACKHVHSESSPHLLKLKPMQVSVFASLYVSHFPLTPVMLCTSPLLNAL